MAQPAQHFEAAQRRQHHVENDQVELIRLLAQALERFGAVAHQRDLETFAGQVLGEHLAELTVVIDDQYGGRQRHAGIRWLGTGRSASRSVRRDHGISISQWLRSFVKSPPGRSG